MKGQLDFSGRKDLFSYLKLCSELEILVLLRPGKLNYFKLLLKHTQNAATTMSKPKLEIELKATTDISESNARLRPLMARSSVPRKAS